LPEVIVEAPNEMSISPRAPHTENLITIENLETEYPAGNRPVSKIRFDSQERLQSHNPKKNIVGNSKFSDMNGSKPTRLPDGSTNITAYEETVNNTLFTSNNMNTPFNERINFKRPINNTEDSAFLEFKESGIASANPQESLPKAILANLASLLAKISNTESKTGKNIKQDANLHENFKALQVTTRLACCHPKAKPRRALGPDRPALPDVSESFIEVDVYHFRTNSSEKLVGSNYKVTLGRLYTEPCEAVSKQPGGSSSNTLAKSVGSEKMDTEIADVRISGAGDFSATNIQTNISYSEKSSIFPVERSSGLIGNTNATNVSGSSRGGLSYYSDRSLTDAPMVVCGSVEANSESQI
jgi:hypothetical protein